MTKAPGNKPPALRAVYSRNPDGSTAAADAVATSPGARAQRRAALNLLEDAVEARQALEKVNVELRRQTAQLTALMETAAVGLHRVGPDGVILWANQAELEMLGYARDEYVGRHISEIHADQDAITDILQRLLRGEELRDREVRLRCKDGAIKIARIDSTALFEDARFVHTQCFTTDITASKQAEQELRESEAKYRTIFDGAAVSLWEEDFSGVRRAVEELRASGVRDFRRYFEEHPEFVQLALSLVEVLDVNDATLKMFEACEKSELLGGLSKIFVPETLPVFIDELVTIAEGRTFMQGEALLNTMRGNPVTVLFTMTVGPRTERMDRCLFSLLDITERTRLEEQMRDQTALLEDQHRRKDEFLAMLAHELRNPLAPIRNAAVALRFGGVLDPKFSWCRDVIERQVGVMAELLEDLLDVSRVARRRIELRLERIELASAISQAVETVRPLIEEMGHELSVRMPPLAIVLNGDLTRLTQIFGNLLNNAAKYTERGGHIALSVEVEGREVIVRVKDSGIGIAAAHLPNVFELFSQVESALSRSRGGLGIGLSLVKALVELHGGRVSAASDGPLQGSEFSVSLPIVEVSTPEIGLAPLPGSVKPSAAGVAVSRRVLVVDDNADVARSMESMLQSAGHDVRVANDGEHAIHLAEQYRPHAVLLDIGMPGMNGYEICQRIRAQDWSSHMLIVACTGWGRLADRARAREAGFDHHLVKPADPEQVLSLIAQEI